MTLLFFSNSNYAGMLAVKRKLNNRKRLSESSNSEDSENSESDKDTSNETQPLTSVSDHKENEGQSSKKQINEELENSEDSKVEEVVDGKLHIRVSGTIWSFFTMS